jgi:hypothetical protein
MFRYTHGPNINEDPKPKMSSLLVPNRVYRLEIQSVMLVFPTSFVTRRYNLLTGSPTPLPPFLCEQVQGYVLIQCVKGGGGGDRGPKTDKYLPPSTFTDQFIRKADIYMVWCFYRYLVHGYTA